MVRSFGKIVSLLVLIGAGSTGVWIYQSRTETQRQIVKLEAEKQALKQVVKRLNDERRVAEIVVKNQTLVDGIKQTELLLVETSRAGETLPPKYFTVMGNEVHVDAMVIKFDKHFVEEGDPLRGQSIALFTKIYGQNQKPVDAPRIDEPGIIPDIYKDADPRVTEYELQLWKDFWRLADDETFRKERGVSVAMGQGVWTIFEPGKLYRINIEAGGGLSLSSEPIKGIYQELLKRDNPATAPR